MTAFTKIAISVPTATYAVVERLRRRLGKSRSAVVALALEDWIRRADLADADRRYIEGYLRVPEAIDEISAVAAQATSHWDRWSPGEPSRAAEPSRVAASSTAEAPPGFRPRSVAGGRQSRSGARSGASKRPRR